MTIKDFNKKQYEEQHGITKFRNTLNRIQYLQKQIRRDSLPSEDYLKAREKEIEKLWAELESFRMY
jgi:hypothetical protein